MTSEGLGEMFEGNSADTHAGKFAAVVRPEQPAPSTVTGVGFVSFMAQLPQATVVVSEVSRLLLGETCQTRKRKLTTGDEWWVDVSDNRKT